MCNAIHSPLPSQVFSSLETLSPPPTPIAKRARCVELTSPVPMFFPMSQSLLRQDAQQDAPYSLAAHGDAVERDQSSLLASSSSFEYSPRLQRRQRRFGNNDDSPKPKVVLSRALLGQIPRPPFSSLLDMSEMESSIPRELASKRMNSFESILSTSSTKNLETRNMGPKTAAGTQQKKPPSKRMNSFESYMSTSTQNSETKNQRKSIERKSSGGSNQEKLPAFHRSGMQRNSASRRNSYVARTA